MSDYFYSLDILIQKYHNNSFFYNSLFSSLWDHLAEENNQ